MGSAILFAALGALYLRVPFLYGDPIDSWALDPARLRSDDWRAFLSRNKIRWVVRSGNYPCR
jgi:hypothetical protein